MNFIEVERTATKKNGEVLRMLGEFVTSGIEVAEIKDWDGDYASVSSTYQAVKNACASHFKNKIKCAKVGDRIFIEKVGK